MTKAERTEQLEASALGVIIPDVTHMRHFMQSETAILRDMVFYLCHSFGLVCVGALATYTSSVL